jgi:hypothetical protein
VASGVSRVCHVAPEAWRAVEAAEMARGRRPSEGAFVDKAGFENSLLLPLFESATGSEYLSKSEGFSAYRLPFQGGLP